MNKVIIDPYVLGALMKVEDIVMSNLELENTHCHSIKVLRHVGRFPYQHVANKVKSH